MINAQDRKGASALFALLIPTVSMVGVGKLYSVLHSDTPYGNGMVLAWVVSLILGFLALQLWPFGSWKWRLGISLAYVSVQTIWLMFVAFYLVCIHGDCI